MRKHGQKVLGLVVLAALGLMAFTATAAQAVNLEWGDKPGSGEVGVFLAGGTERPTGLTKETVFGKQIGSGKLLIPNKSAEVVCGTGKIVGEAFIQNEYEDYLIGEKGGMKKGGHGQGTVLFEECTVQEINPTTGALTGKELTECTKNLNVATSPPGKHHVTATALLLVRKHEGVTYLVAEPLITSKAIDEKVAKLEQPFTTLKFGGTCSLPETVNILGALSVAAPVADAVKPKLAIETFSETGKKLQELLGTKLKFGASEAFIQAEAEAELTGPGALLKWGAM